MSAEKAIVWYSYSIVAFCVVGVTFVHIPPAMGYDWSSYKIFCDSWVWGSLVIHFFETPVIFFNLYVAYFGLKKLTPETRENYLSLLSSSFTTNFGFFTIECVQLFFSFPNHAAGWEKTTYVSIVVLMLGALIFLLYVKNLLLNQKTGFGLEVHMDGFYHPSTEEEIVYLVKEAATRNVKIRCRGAAHSLSHAIYAGPLDYPNKVSLPHPSRSEHINIMLDRYKKFRWLDDKTGVVEVEAGIHLGDDPNDDPGQSSFENGLLYQIKAKNFTLEDLGGIIHQTLSGFLMTGSSGGSLQYNIIDNIEAFSMIDGEGNVEWFYKGEDHFNALLTSLGVQGIMSKIRLKLSPMFIIEGEEKTVAMKECEVDLFDEKTLDKKVPLMDFFKKNAYARLLWWPQPKVERVVIWKADRPQDPPEDNFERQPYSSLSKYPFTALFLQTGGCVIFTMLKNRYFFKAWKKLLPVFMAYKNSVYQIWGSTFTAWVAAWIVVYLLMIVCFAISILFFIVKIFEPKSNPWLPTWVVKMFQGITKKGQTRTFSDYPWGSLAMDNEINDTILATEFTEMWVPIEEASKAMNFMRRKYEENRYKACGYYATELYATEESDIWLSPSYGTKVLRIDLFWFTHNEGDPSAETKGEDGFFNQFWDDMKTEGITFRLHWGKFLPGHKIAGSTQTTYPEWATYLSKQYPRWDDFMKLRAKRDPKNIFMTDYWSLHLFGK
ncbi:MAG: FAD-binding protein [Cyclobacteriaceae bacterium]|nr:FAD-binding protein [Cyclobacteriaceae bacterium]